MYRNEIEETKRPKREPRYSKINPPPSENVANKKASLLNQSIVNINTKLQLKRPEEFFKPEDYDIWRRNATAARGYMERELDYLENWVAVRQEKQKIRKEAKEEKEQAETTWQPIKEFARNLADEIGGQYSLVYSNNVLPKDLAAAQSRSEELVEFKVCVEEALQEVFKRGVYLPYNKEISRESTAPLREILRAVEKELSLVRKYIRIKSAKYRRNWKIVIGMVERAVAQGLQPTLEEESALNDLRTFFKLMPSQPSDVEVHRPTLSEYRQKSNSSKGILAGLKSGLKHIRARIKIRITKHKTKKKERNK